MLVHNFNILTKGMLIRFRLDMKFHYLLEYL